MDQRPKTLDRAMKRAERGILPKGKKRPRKTPLRPDTHLRKVRST